MKMTTPKKLNQEERESLEDILQSRKEDAVPRYLNMDEIKMQRQQRMCKFYAYHLECY